MKNLGLALGLTLTMLFSPSMFAEDFIAEDSSEHSLAEKPADPVSELRNQDSAFALLTEAFRQLQSYLIESDYDARIEAAKSLKDPVARRKVTALAQQERELRLKKLYGQLDRMNTTYDYARQEDERVAGVTVSKNVDTVAAAHKLKDFVIISPDAFDSPAAVAPKALPASIVLLDTTPVR